MEMNYMFYVIIYLSIGGLITLYVEKAIHQIAEETQSELPPITNFMRIRMMVMWPFFAISSLINLM